MKVPEYPDCEKVEFPEGSKDSTPLTKFVYYHEPAGSEHTKQFREQLRAVLDLVSEDVIENFVCFLIDAHETDIITEEGLRQYLVDYYKLAESV